MRIGRRRLLVLSAAGLTGCIGRMQPMGPVLGSPVIAPGAHDAIVAADGYRLPLRRWLPATEPRAVILALHGANDHAGGFEDGALFWAQLGLATYAYDQRGFGATRERGIWPGTETLAADAQAALALLRQAHRDVPVYLLGESMGGAVAIVAATDAGAPRPDGLILAAPAAWGLQAMGPVEKAALWIVSTFMPAMTFTGEGLDLQASDNIPMLAALGRDPLYIGETRADTIAGLVDLMTVAYDRIPAIRERTLVLYGENEEVLSPSSVDAVLAHLPERPAEAPDGVLAASYKNGWHLLLRDLGRRTPQRDIAAWVLSPGLATLPSGAERRGAARRREVRTE